MLTYSFLHASLTHLAVNMLAILLFGSDVEHELGSWRFAVYYLCCVVSAALIQLALGIILGIWTDPRWAPRAACSGSCSPSACCSRGRSWCR